MEEQEYIYKPEELIFVIMAGDDHDFGDIVVFTTKECWGEDKCCSDDLGMHNMPGELLLSCGVQDGEIMESHFETTGEFDLETVRTKLLEAGFTEVPEFTEFINEHQ